MGVMRGLTRLDAVVLPRLARGARRIGRFTRRSPGGSLTAFAVGLAVIVSGVLVVQSMGHRQPIQPDQSARVGVTNGELIVNYLAESRDRLAQLTATAPDRPAAVAVAVAGREGLVAAADVDALLAARCDDVVRLLPPSDPFLQGRDRELLVPGAAHRRQVWPALGAPGVVVSGVDVVGVWRPTLKGKRLDVAVTAFRPLGAQERAAVTTEAERLAVVRGANEVNLR